MDPGLLHVLHHPADQELVAIEDGIHVHLGGGLEEPVDEQRSFAELELRLPLDLG